MPTHTDPVIINGSTDAEQLVVRGHTTQTKALQEWRKDATTLYGRVTNDGRLQVGTFTSGNMDTDDSLIEAHRGEADTTKPKRGLHLMGAITGALTDVVSWVVHELTLKGTSISVLHNALRVRLRSEATGATGSAELRGGDIEVINAGLSGTMPTITGLRVAVDQETGAAATAVYGVKVELTDVPNTAYALHTSAGKVHFGGLSTGLVHADSNGDLTSTILVASDIPNGIISLDKLANGTPDKLIGFNASGVPSEIDAPSGTGTGSASSLLAATWGEAVLVRDIVYFNLADSKWYRVDNNVDTPLKIGVLRGFVQDPGTGLSDGTGKVQVSGLLNGFSGLTPGLLVYASDVPGAYTQTKPVVTAGGGQVAVCLMGRALTTTKVLVDPTEAIRYMKRAVLAQTNMIELKHQSEDEASPARKVYADISTTLTTAIQSYSSSNQNIGVPLGKAGATLTIASTQVGTAHLGRQTNTRRMAQAFQVATAGIFSQFSVNFTTAVGSPPGQVEWRIETDNAGKPSGNALQSGFVASPTTNSVIDVPGMIYLNTGTVYWLVLTPTLPLGVNQYWQVWLNDTNQHAGGMWRTDEAVGAGAYPGTWTSNTNVNIDLNSMVKTKEYVKLSMGFQNPTANTITSVRLWLKKTGAPTAALTCAIYSDNAGSPNAVIANGTATTQLSSAVALTYGWLTFTFPTPPTIAAGTPYHIVLTTAAAPSASAYVEWGADNSAPSYANGLMKAQSTTVLPVWASMPTTTHASFEVNALGSFITKGMIGHWAGGDQSTFGLVQNDAMTTTLKNNSATSYDVTFTVEV